MPFVGPTRRKRSHQAAIAAAQQVLVPLQSNQQKAHFSLAYVQAIASQAGHALSAVSQDVDTLAFDVTLEFAEAGIRIQLKCSAVRHFNKAGTLQFPVEEPWIRKWGMNHNPTYCILVMVPSTISDWIAHRQLGSYQPLASPETLFRASAYWARVDRLDASASSITFSRRQRFTADTVRRWREDLHNGYSCEGGAHD